MKKSTLLILFLATILFACNQSVKKTGEAGASDQDLPDSLEFYGSVISPEEAKSAAELPALFTQGDTIAIKLVGEVTSCCQHSGCWMDMEMTGKEVVNITFEEGAFTIPKDAKGKKAIVEGIAYREVIPVETLKNWARDEGKSEEEIEKITQAAMNYSLIAKGVILEKETP